MRSLARLTILLTAAIAAAAQAAFGAGLSDWTDSLFSGRPQTPHPAVVRVIAPSRDNTTSLGSGVLVAVNERHGLVLTNWHVVEEAAGQITVVFPNGFRSGATLVKADRDWDLAALAIWRPNVTPVALATQAPPAGAPLTIAGYGSGSYRAATGRCVQYASPGRNLPYEMIELSTAARQGDSGGPILNDRGEVAGILSAAGSGCTVGTYCGRIRGFLASIPSDSQRAADGSMIARQSPSPAAQGYGRPSQDWQGSNANPLCSSGQVATDWNRQNNPGYAGSAAPGPSGSYPAAAIPAGQASTPPAAAASLAATGQPGDDGQGGSLLEQAKNILAVIGVIAIFFMFLRLLLPNSSSEASAGK
jgi:S1-C subfamily serine protease